MPAYRFCRTDDIQLLVAALNACYVVHFPDQMPLSVADFKREMRELDIWASSCMVASEDGEPIAVVTGAKREHQTLIHRIGVHPDFQRRGHAQHLLESLSHKLSVLGPPKIVAEVPDDLSAVRDLFEAVGHKEEGRLTDFVLAEPLAAPSGASQVAPIGLDDLLSAGVLDARVSRSWERALETLQNRKDQLEGLAITSEKRVEAYAVYRDLPEYSRREIVSFGGSDQLHENDPHGLLEELIRVACQAGTLQVTIPRVSEEEIAGADLESMGFRRGRTYFCYVDLPGSRMH